MRNIAVKGTFDDCQNMVKAFSTTWNSRKVCPGRGEFHQLGTVLAQVSLLLSAYFRSPKT